MKLHMSINAFDSTELLEQMITEIRDQVDRVYAVWQKKSYWGNDMLPQDMEELQRLQSIGLIDELLEFVPDFTKYSREQECEKRNMSVAHMRAKGATHVLNIDADEFYKHDQFAEAKLQIEQSKIPITYCTYVNYYRDFDHYLVYPFTPLVPFIHHSSLSYMYNGPAPGPSDPTRRLFDPYGFATKVFTGDKLMMHHAAWIRKDIRKKLENWSAKDNFKPELITEAEARWNNWTEGDDAIMLFMTPENKVYVKKLETPLCKFKVPWLE